MKSHHITIAFDIDEYHDKQINVDVLKHRSLFKTLSLVLSHRAGVPTPPLLLLCWPKLQLIREAGERWGWPLMVRMDFETLPSPKFIGGIQVFTVESAVHVSNYLFSHKCFPLFHPHIDRFWNQYSVGILFDPSNPSVVHAEIVGEGFDAGDLRLGAAIPHEMAQIDLEAQMVKPLSRIDKDSYTRECAARRLRIEALRRYITFVNAEGRLSSDLDIPDIVTHLSTDLLLYEKIRYDPHNLHRPEFYAAIKSI